MIYRVIALDLDGTLLTESKQILPESLEILTLARQQGIHVIIATGRHHVAIKPFYHALALTTPAICCNGSYIYDMENQSILNGNPLTKPQAKRVIELLNEHNMHSLMYVDNAMVYEQLDDNIRYWYHWSETQSPSFRPTLRQVDSFTKEVDNVHYVWKFAVLSQNNHQLCHIQYLLKNEMDLACEFSLHNQMDITQSGSNKGNMLNGWVNSQGISMQNVIAFGDNFNDITMLKMAGFGVAMGNSADEIKAIADMTTTKNTLPGIANVIRERVLNN